MDPSFAPFAAHAYVQARVDRADPLRNDPAALAALWPRAQALVVDERGRVRGDPAAGPCWVPAPSVADGPEAAVFLGVGRDDGVARFAVARLEAAPGPVVELRDAASLWPAGDAALYAYARAMVLWQLRTRFCPQCGAPLSLRRSGFVAWCGACGQEHYPRVDPAVIVAVSDGDRLLLGRQPAWPARRMSVIAGFVEPGETLEQTVCREVHEETRVVVDITSCRYLGSQPWPFPGALMLGFTARGSGEPEVDGELELACWVDREAVGRALAGTHPDIDLPPPLSIARSLVAHWHATTG